MSDLGHRARTAVLWTTGFGVFRDVLQFALTVTLARLLPPEAYGQFGLVTTLVGLLTVFSFREFLNHTLQVRDDEATHYQDHFTAGAVVQGLVFGAANLVALGMRAVPAYRPAAPMLHVLSLLLLLDLPSEFRVKMLERSLDWKRLRLLHALGLLTSGATSVVMAAAGFGAWALLAPLLLVPVPFIWDLFIGAGFRPTWQWSRERYGPAWRFGLTRMASAGLVSGAGAAESAALVRLVGFGILGLYNRAVGLAALSCQKIASTLLQALYPVLTRIEPRTPQYRRASSLLLRVVAWAVVPMAVGLSLLREPVVRFLYGTRWLDAIPLVPWALAMAAVLALVHATYTLLLAHGQQRRCLHMDVARLAGTLVALATLAPRGLQWYLGGLVALQVAILIVALGWLQRDDAIEWAGILGGLAPAGASAALALVVCLVLQRATRVAIGPIWTGALYGTVFAASYVAVLRLVFASHLREILECLPRRQRLTWLLGLEPAA